MSLQQPQRFSLRKFHFNQHRIHHIHIVPFINISLYEYCKKCIHYLNYRSYSFYILSPLSMDHKYSFSIPVIKFPFYLHLYLYLPLLLSEFLFFLYINFMVIEFHHYISHNSNFLHRLSCNFHTLIYHNL